MHRIAYSLGLAGGGVQAVGYALHDPMRADPAEGRTSVTGALWLLMLVYMFSLVDRQVFNILAAPLGKELRLSDSQIGLMGGLAFAVFYTSLGLPLARLVDQPASNRVTLMTVCLAVWSAFTVGSAFALNFWQMLFARVGIGAGEAGCSPAATSLIADLVPVRRRTSALAFYMMANPIGTLLGLALGGFVAQQYGWRAAFLVLGPPGLLLALALPRLLPEPRALARATHSAAQFTTGGRPSQTSFKEVLAELMRSKAFLLLLLATSVTGFLAYGRALFTVLFFARTHHLSTSLIGLCLGISTGLGGITGAWIGGRIGDRFGSLTPRHYLTPPALALLMTGPVFLAAYNAPDWRLAFLLLFTTSVLNTLLYGPVLIVSQRICQSHARGMAVAVKTFTENLIGLGLGPLAFGLASDMLKPTAGSESVRWVLTGSTALAVLPAAAMYAASRFVDREVVDEEPAAKIGIAATRLPLIAEVRS